MPSGKTIGNTALKSPAVNRVLCNRLGYTSSNALLTSATSIDNEMSTLLSFRNAHMSSKRNLLPKRLNLKTLKIILNSFRV